MNSFVLLYLLFLRLFVLVLFQIKKFAECLDPNANGKISFEDFCHGVFAMKGNTVRGFTLICIHVGLCDLIIME